MESLGIIVIFGFCRARNAGDEALPDGILRQFRTIHPIMILFCQVMANKLMRLPQDLVLDKQVESVSEEIHARR